jgi:hypothetical protein
MSRASRSCHPIANAVTATIGIRRERSSPLRRRVRSNLDRVGERHCPDFQRRWEQTRPSRCRGQPHFGITITEARSHPGECARGPLVRDAGVAIVERAYRVRADEPRARIGAALQRFSFSLGS